MVGTEHVGERGWEERKDFAPAKKRSTCHHDEQGGVVQAKQ
jgi:hypothetical protein